MFGRMIRFVARSLAVKVKLSYKMIYSMTARLGKRGMIIWMRTSRDIMG